MALEPDGPEEPGPHTRKAQEARKSSTSAPNKPPRPRRAAQDTPGDPPDVPKGRKRPPRAAPEGPRWLPELPQKPPGGPKRQHKGPKGPSQPSNQSIFTRVSNSERLGSKTDSSCIAMLRHSRTHNRIALRDAQNAPATVEDSSLSTPGVPHGPSKRPKPRILRLFRGTLEATMGHCKGPVGPP